MRRALKMIGGILVFTPFSLIFGLVYILSDQQAVAASDAAAVTMPIEKKLESAVNPGCLEYFSEDETASYSSAMNDCALAVEI